MNVSKREGGYAHNGFDRIPCPPLFLCGMPGSGKTSELAKYIDHLHNPECYYCIKCDIDTDLDVIDLEYIDILLFQIERLVKSLEKR